MDDDDVTESKVTEFVPNDDDDDLEEEDDLDGRFARHGTELRSPRETPQYAKRDLVH